MRTGIFHHSPDPVSHLRFIAVHRALGTPWFVLPERTLLEAHDGIFQELPAFGAEPGSSAMMSVTEDPDHRFECPAFRSHISMNVCHNKHCIPRRILGPSLWCRNPCLTPHGETLCTMFGPPRLCEE